MTLEYELRRSYGRIRFYPLNKPAVAVATARDSETLSQDDLLELERAGFTIRVKHGTAENIDWRPRETGK